MSIIFRPHRMGMDIGEAMGEAKKFNDVNEMKDYIVKRFHEGLGKANTLFTADDIVILEESVVNDKRIGWKDSKYVCLKKFGDEDYMKKHGTPQCVGMCATEYKKKK